MFKRVMLALTGLLIVFALTIGQGAAALAADSDEAAGAGALVVWSEPGFSGSFAVVYEKDIPRLCSVVPPLGTAGSAVNATSGTRIGLVEFFSDAACATRVATLVAGTPNAVAQDLGGHATHYRGVPTSPSG